MTEKLTNLFNSHQILSRKTISSQRQSSHDTQLSATSHKSSKLFSEEKPAPCKTIAHCFAGKCIRTDETSSLLIISIPPRHPSTLAEHPPNHYSTSIRQQGQSHKSALLLQLRLLKKLPLIAIIMHLNSSVGIAI